MRLGAEEFIRRFLLHVLPRGFIRPLRASAARQKHHSAHACTMEAVDAEIVCRQHAVVDTAPFGDRLVDANGAKEARRFRSGRHPRGPRLSSGPEHPCFRPCPRRDRVAAEEARQARAPGLRGNAFPGGRRTRIPTAQHMKDIRHKNHTGRPPNPFARNGRAAIWRAVPARRSPLPPSRRQNTSGPEKAPVTPKIPSLFLILRNPGYATSYVTGFHLVRRQNPATVTHPRPTPQSYFPKCNHIEKQKPPMCLHERNQKPLPKSPNPQ